MCGIWKHGGHVWHDVAFCSNQMVPSCRSCLPLSDILSNQMVFAILMVHHDVALAPS